MILLQSVVLFLFCRLVSSSNDDDNGDCDGDCDAGGGCDNNNDW